MSIVIENLSYEYPAAATFNATTDAAVEGVLQGINLKVEDGEFIGIMGHTGCGKTTLLQIMAGLLTPTGGRVLLDGVDINQKGYDRSRLRRKVGVVFQYPEYQLFETTVEKDVVFGLKYSGLDRNEISRRAKDALEQMGFSYEQVRGQSPLALSGGEKRRVAVAGVLAAAPKLLLLDEPVAGLDPQGREAFLKQLSALNEKGVTIVMVSHNGDAIGECTRRLVVLEQGRMAADGRTEEVFQKIYGKQGTEYQVSAAYRIAETLRERGMELPSGITAYSDLLSALKEQIGRRETE